MRLRDVKKIYASNVPIKKLVWSKTVVWERTKETVTIGFTSSQNWPVPAGVLSMTITFVGSGGGGGLCISELTQEEIHKLPTIVSIVVGAGGSNSAGSFADGGAGGISKFGLLDWGSYITITGGIGGASCAGGTPSSIFANKNMSNGNTSSPVFGDRQPGPGIVVNGAERGRGGLGGNLVTGAGIGGNGYVLITYERYK